MELSKEQIEQLMDLELRRLDRDYQRTIAADNAMPARVEGTPNLDALIREATEKAGQPELNCSQDLQNEEKAAKGSQSGSWDTQSEGADDQPELAGFQRLDDPADDSDDQGSNSMTFSTAALRRSFAGAVLPGLKSNFILVLVEFVMNLTQLLKKSSRSSWMLSSW